MENVGLLREGVVAKRGIELVGQPWHWLRKALSLTQTWGKRIGIGMGIRGSGRANAILAKP